MPSTTPVSRLVLLGALLLIGCQTTPPPPNLILILSDDAGYADFGFQGSTTIATPHLDTLATRGVRFTNGYVTASVCAPSRAGLITGRYQQRFGFEYNLPGKPDPLVPDTIRGLPLTEHTIADLLREQGYATGMIGKWHLGLEDRFHPLHRGFDTFFGMRKGSSPYTSGKATAIEAGFEPVPADSLPYLTDAFGTQAISFIRRHQQQPFFLYLSFNAPHTPMQARPDYMQEARPHFETEVRAANAAMTRSMDEQIGRIVAVLDETGLRVNTLVFFGNDNGGAMPYNGSLNSPLRGTKGTTLEGGNRVPFLLSWPGVLPEGTAYDAPVSTLDLLPTFLTAAGGTLPANRTYDGVDLLPFLTAPSTHTPHDTLYWKLNWGAAIRAGDWKLVRTPANDHLLFDLAQDIGETHDLSDTYPTVCADLMAALMRWENTLPPPVWVSAPIWRGHSLERYDQRTVDSFIRQ